VGFLRIISDRFCQVFGGWGCQKLFGGHFGTLVLGSRATRAKFNI